MVDGAAAPSRPSRLAAEHPELSIGLHFVDDTPALDDPGHAAREFAAQLERFRALMRSEPTHVDSHHHVHLRRMPTFERLVEPLGVPLRGDGRVRYLGAFFAHPEQAWSTPTGSASRFSCACSKPRSTDEFVELGCHPGRVTAELRSSYGLEREDRDRRRWPPPELRREASRTWRPGTREPTATGAPARGSCAPSIHAAPAPRARARGPNPTRRTAPPSEAFARLGEAAVRLGRLPDDGQAQPRPGLGAGLLGAVEAVEHERQILLVEARAVVAYGQRPVVERHLDDPAVRAPLGRVVEQVGDRARDPGRPRRGPASAR